MLHSLRAFIAAHRDDMSAFLAELIALDTENPPGRSYETCLDQIARKLEELGLASEVLPVPGGDADPNHPRYWLRSRWGGSGPSLYFHGHVDVVPANGENQFEPRITEDTVFGRGSTDMKGGLVSMIYAMKALEETGAALDGGIELRIVPDEETGGRLGSRALSDAGLLFDKEALGMLTAEPTGGIVWHASRGAITGNVVLEGRKSHVGLQYRGINAFEKAIPVLNALRELKADVETRETDFPLEPEEARHSILLMGGEVTGGANFNVVPDYFVFSVDRRINPEEDFEEEKRRLVSTVEAAGARFEIHQEAHPASVSADHPVAQALSRSVEEVSGSRPSLELCPGILEIRFYAERGVPALAYGPGLLTVAHGPSEFVKRKDLESCALVYAMAAQSLLS
jgi:succinyl-diaminopimelate desuccinylase